MKRKRRKSRRRTGRIEEQGRRKRWGDEEKHEERKTRRIWEEGMGDGIRKYGENKEKQRRGEKSKEKRDWENKIEMEPAHGKRRRDNAKKKMNKCNTSTVLQQEKRKQDSRRVFK
jgi:hypothetical protein